MIDLLANTTGTLTIVTDEKQFKGVEVTLRIQRNTREATIVGRRTDAEDIIRPFGVLQERIMEIIQSIDHNSKNRLFFVRMSGWSLAETSALILEIMD